MATSMDRAATTTDCVRLEPPSGPIRFLGLVALLAGNLLLAPRFGLMGAAVAALISIALWSAAQWFTVLRTAKVDVSIRARLLRPRIAVDAVVEPAE